MKGICEQFISFDTAGKRWGKRMCKLEIVTPLKGIFFCIITNTRVRKDTCKSDCNRTGYLDGLSSSGIH